MTYMLSMLIIVFYPLVLICHFRELTIAQLKTEFSMSDMSLASYLLGIVVTRTLSYMLLFQQKYA